MTTVLAGVGGLSLAALGGAAGYTAWALSGPRRPDLDYTFTPFEVGVDAEDVTFHAADGVRLAGWWLERAGSDRVVICCHGHRGAKADLLGIGPGLWRAGNTVLLFDFRGCGASADGPQSLAHTEQQDLRAAVDFVRARRPQASIAVVGFSMGASVAALVAAEDPRISALVLDSPFATMRDVVASAYRRYRLPTRPLLDAADLVTRLRYGYQFAHVAPEQAIGALAPRPLLLLHGDADRIIPLEHAHRMFAAAGEPKELVIFPGAEHCGGYFADRQGYIDRVADFLERSC
ncbi:MAG: alpha/beta hydrolase [Actinomycetales bacterium]